MKGGFSDLRLFLENKYINEAFYEGKFEGRDCIVKCSRSWRAGRDFEEGNNKCGIRRQVK